LNLPAPSVLRDQETARLNSTELKRINSDIAKLQLADPEALSEVEKATLADLQASGVNETISSMQLPEPEKLHDAPQSKPSAGKEDTIPVPVPNGSITQTDKALLSEPTAAPTASSLASAPVNDQVVTPWDVEGAIVDGKQVGIDYDKLIQQFGTKRIDDALLQRFEKLTSHRPHRLLRRGMFFSHRWVEKH
jgi:tryptophanyl-tRNA synthetase